MLEENTPYMYNALARRLGKLITWTLGAPTPERAKWARIRLNEVLRKYMEQSAVDPFSRSAMYVLELARRPGRLAAILKNGEEALNEHLEKLSREWNRQYKKKVLYLAALVNQADSALRYMESGINYVPKSATEVNTLSLIDPRDRERLEASRKLSKASFTAFAKAVKETKDNMGLKREEMYFTSRDDAIRRLAEIKEELYSIFPEERKRLKGKKPRY